MQNLHFPYTLKKCVEKTWHKKCNSQGHSEPGLEHLCLFDVLKILNYSCFFLQHPSLCVLATSYQATLHLLYRSCLLKRNSSVLKFKLSYRSLFYLDRGHFSVCFTFKFIPAYYLHLAAIYNIEKNTVFLLKITRFNFQLCNFDEKYIFPHIMTSLENKFK